MSSQRIKKKLAAVTLGFITLGGSGVVAKQDNPDYWHYERAVASTQEQPLQPPASDLD
ncbi:hypothetical protein OG943_26600 [Amycolatopsis sp. NBC_00345]|uniref:hypothetical protein n=1 Tax=Amycolatopsis sp. NBC_00345 TaxID=2975955 RepID=UPI002E26E4D2